MANGNDSFNPFDVLEGLKDTGFQQDQAEFLARILSNVELRNMATKKDLEASTLALKHDIKELDFKIETIKKDIETVKAELKRDIAELNNNLTKYISDKADAMTSKVMTFTGLAIGFISVLMVVLRFWPV